MTSAPGRSRCMVACQVCTYPSFKLGSTPNVLVNVFGGATKPFASVRGLVSELASERLVDSGDCCDMRTASGKYVCVSYAIAYPARITMLDAMKGRHETPTRGWKACLFGFTSDDGYCDPETGPVGLIATTGFAAVN